PRPPPRPAPRRSTRVGAQSGVPLEDLGVVPDERYFMTRDDLLQHNIALIAHAAKILAGQVVHGLEIAAGGAAPLGTLHVKARSIDRVDLLVNDRPTLSRD